MRIPVIITLVVISLLCAFALGRHTANHPDQQPFQPLPDWSIYVVPPCQDEAYNVFAHGRTYRSALRAANTLSPVRQAQKDPPNDDCDAA